MDENKFTPTAEEALQLAQEAAGELGHGYMGTEHQMCIRDSPRTGTSPGYHRPCQS